MIYTEENIEKGIKGSFAEKIFELLHSDLGCLVYKTGQEHIAPHLLNIANAKRKLHHFSMKWSDKKLFDQKTINEKKNSKSVSGSDLATSPDFTVVTSSGTINFFEVKFVAKGNPYEEHKEKCLRRRISPIMFVVSPIKPYIKIFVAFQKIECEEASGEIPKQKVKEFFEDEILKGNSQAELEKKIIKVKKFSKPFYSEIKRESDHSIILTSESQLPSESLVYPYSTIRKYENIIKKWTAPHFKNLINKNLKDF